MLRALICGATGYTGIELVRILSSHPDVTVTRGSSLELPNHKMSQVLSFIGGENDFSLLTLEEVLDNPDADVAFLALPHGASALAARHLLEAGLKVIDLSADCRLQDPKVYAEWYGDHKAPELLARAVYGLPETKRESIRGADLVANPGCYPTTVILGVAPLLKVDSVDTSCPISDSKSGVSGAGRGGKLTTSFCEAGGGCKPYGVTSHRHIPEMEQELSSLGGSPVKVRFTPHLIPASRGMVSTIYLPLRKETTAAQLQRVYEDRYASEPFVRVLPHGIFPDTAQVRGSNQCHISVEVDQRTGWVVVMVAIDNLVKGASGAAVQNMNLMLDIPETVGLSSLPVFP